MPPRRLRSVRSLLNRRGTLECAGFRPVSVARHLSMRRAETKDVTEAGGAWKIGPRFSRAACFRAQTAQAAAQLPRQIVLQDPALSAS